MPDWMDRVTAMAEEAGIKVRQTDGGAWLFIRGGDTFTLPSTPATASEWLAAVNMLRDMGLDIPDG